MKRFQCILNWVKYRSYRTNQIIYTHMIIGYVQYIYKIINPEKLKWKGEKKRLSNLSCLLKNKWTCGHKLLVSERLVIDRSMLSPFSWERLYYQYYQISKALYVSGLKTGYKLKINFYSQNVVIFHQFKASVLLVTHHNGTWSFLPYTEVWYCRIEIFLWKEET